MRPARSSLFAALRKSEHIPFQMRYARAMPAAPARRPRPDSPTPGTGEPRGLTTSSAPDRGYFPAGASMLRQVHGERRVGLMYGQRALTLGAIKPLNYVGTAEHSGHKADPFQRLTRTAIAFESIFFGTRAEADRILTYVHKMHSRVNGELPEDAGIYRAGTPYDAFDPALMLWTVAAMMDSAEVMHDLLVRRLTSDERAALWGDYRRFAMLFGMPDDALPSSYPEFREYLDAELTAADVHLTDQAQYVGWFASFDIRAPCSADHCARRTTSSCGGACRSRCASSTAWAGRAAIRLRSAR